MKIIIAKHAGFCFGVKRAIEVVYKEIEKGEKVYTFGPIIHNEIVVNDLNEKGVSVIHDIEELKLLSEGTIVIRSHGISKKMYEIMEQSNLKVVDATCPFVKKIHKHVEEQSRKGSAIVIIGSGSHPEVEGIKGWCHNGAIVLSKEEEAQNFHLNAAQKVCIVAQTTFNYKKFQDLVEIISKKGYDILALNTICNATEERQTEAKQLARISEAMIVIGGKNSSNTQKLYEICEKECENTYYIQKLVDLDLKKFESFGSVGITAGASTPNNIIKEVQIACQK